MQIDGISMTTANAFERKLALLLEIGIEQSVTQKCNAFERVRSETLLNNAGFTRSQTRSRTRFSQVSTKGFSHG